MSSSQRGQGRLGYVRVAISGAVGDTALESSCGEEAAFCNAAAKAKVFAHMELEFWSRARGSIGPCY
jgi:hypothetical protein